MPKKRELVNQFKKRINWNFLVVFASFAFVPLFIGDPYIIHILILALLFGALSVSYDIVFGYAGQLNFGPAGFFGVGAYVSALSAMRLGISPFFGLLLGGCVTAILGCLIGIPCLRLKGYAYVAVVTWGFAEILRVIFANWIELTRGYLGLWGIPPLPKIDVLGVIIDFSTSEIAWYYFMLLLLVVITSLLYWIIKSPHGLFMVAIREDELAAEVAGVDVTKYKIFAFGISSFFMGVVGGFYAHYIQVLTPSIMGIEISNQIIAYQIVGGSGTLLGPIFGSLILTLISEYLRVIGPLRLIIFGMLMIVVIIYAPLGLYGSIKRVVARWHKKGFMWEALKPCYERLCRFGCAFRAYFRYCPRPGWSSCGSEKNDE